MDILRWTIKEEHIIGISPLMMHKQPATEIIQGAYFYFDVYTISNSIQVRTDNLMYDAVQMTGSKEHELFAKFKKDYQSVYKTIKRLIETPTPEPPKPSRRKAAAAV